MNSRLFVTDGEGGSAGILVKLLEQEEAFEHELSWGLGGPSPVDPPESPSGLRWHGPGSVTMLPFLLLLFERYPTQAHEHYDKAIKLDPSNITFYTNKAACYFEEQKFDKCIELCKKAVEIGQREQSEALPLLHSDGSAKKPELPAQSHKPTCISTIDEPPEYEGEAEYQDWSSSPEQLELPIATPTQTKSPQNDEAVPVTTRVTEEEKPTIGPKKQKTAAPVQEFQAATPNVPAQTFPNESLPKHPSAVGEEKPHIVAEKNTATFGSSITETVSPNKDESVAVEPEEVPIASTSQKERSPKKEAASPIKSPRERTPIKLPVEPPYIYNFQVGECSLDELSDHVLYGAAVTGVRQLDLTIEAAYHVKGGTVRGFHFENVGRLPRVGQANRELFLASQPQRVGILAGRQLEGEDDAHTD
ncbi:unnamed protein product, partial [Mesorhabditis spiculigera]